MLVDAALEPRPHHLVRAQMGNFTIRMLSKYKEFPSQIAHHGLHAVIFNVLEEFESTSPLACDSNLSKSYFGETYPDNSPLKKVTQHIPSIATHHCYLTAVLTP